MKHFAKCRSFKTFLYVKEHADLTTSYETISRKTDLVLVEIGLQRHERNRVTNIMNSIPGALFGPLAMTMLKDMTESTERQNGENLPP